MHPPNSAATKLGHRQRWLRSLLSAAVLPLLCGLFGGCASFTNPVAEGIPVKRLPPEYLASPKDETKSIPHTLLQRSRPEKYTVDVGDVVGFYIEGVIGDKLQPVPFRYPEVGNPAPALGYPLPVGEDGTLPLPQINPLYVKGKTIPEIRKAMIKAYTVDKEIIKPGTERIIVTLVQPRNIQVLVVRQDGGTTQQATGGGVFGGGSTVNFNTGVNTGGIGNLRRSTGQVVFLPADQNDVLHALTRSGGLPGFDAVNEVIIERGYNSTKATDAPSVPDGEKFQEPEGDGKSTSKVVRIPLRLRDGEKPPFTAEDIVLNNGDIVFIEARDTQVYHVGGLLSPRQFLLPRDFDYTVVEAIALAGGPLINGPFSQNNLAGNVNASGLGSPSPSRVSVIRRTKDRGQVVIQVDLNRATRDRRENIIIRAGDIIILQETPGESLTRYLTTVFRFTYLATFINNAHLNFASDANLP